MESYTGSLRESRSFSLNKQTQNNFKAWRLGGRHRNEGCLLPLEALLVVQGEVGDVFEEVAAGFGVADVGVVVHVGDVHIAAAPRALRGLGLAIDLEAVLLRGALHVGDAAENANPGRFALAAHIQPVLDRDLGSAAVLALLAEGGRADPAEPLFGLLLVLQALGLALALSRPLASPGVPPGVR